MKKRDIWIILGIVILAILTFYAWNLAGDIFGPGPEGWRSGANLLKMSNEEIVDSLEKISNNNGNNKTVSMLPSSGMIYLKSKEKGVIVFGIKNVKNFYDNFSYNVSIISNTSRDCGKSSEEFLNLITSQRSDSEIIIAPQELSVNKILFYSEGSFFCSVRYSIDVYSGDEMNPYGRSYFVVNFN